MIYQGLTWDHPRGYNALAEAARRVNAKRQTPMIQWSKQPLEGFESAPISAAAARHDLVVLDHPHIGEAVVEGCLIPLEDLYSEEQINNWRSEIVGPALSSYQWEGQTWALPLDVATQVMARCEDRLSAAPKSWEAILEIASSVPVAQSLAGSHALITLMSIAAGNGHSPSGEDFLSDDAGGDALAIMHRLFASRPEGSELLNPIQLLENMVYGDQIALVPLVFGYVTYAQGGSAPRTLAYSDSIRSPGCAGGVLGGTGICFSRRSTPSQDLLEHIAWLLRSEVQVGLFQEHGGQPCVRSAWLDSEVNLLTGNFYRNTLATAETALLRPRFDGYVAFQTAASVQILTALATREDELRTLRVLRELWGHARANARGNLDDNQGSQK